MDTDRLGGCKEEKATREAVAPSTSIVATFVLVQTQIEIERERDSNRLLRARRGRSKIGGWLTMG